MRFETGALETDNYQGNAVVNFTDREAPYISIIEHKWFTFGRNAKGEDLKGTVISREVFERMEAGRGAVLPGQ